MNYSVHNKCHGRHEDREDDGGSGGGSAGLDLRDLGQRAHVADPASRSCRVLFRDLLLIRFTIRVLNDEGDVGVAVDVGVPVETSVSNDQFQTMHETTHKNEIQTTHGATLRN